MDRIGEGKYGNERFWMRQNLPGLPGLGIIERGTVWKDPRAASISEWV